jgi:pyruvate dehydrogenase complex dehydrogenase (E1) component
MDRRTFEERSGNGETRDWREICEEILRESSSERVNVLLEELLNALEKRDGSMPSSAYKV